MILGFVKPWMAAAALTATYVLLLAIVSGVWSGDGLPSPRDFLIGVGVWLFGVAVALFPVALLLRIVRCKLKHWSGWGRFGLAGFLGLVTMTGWAYAFGGEWPSWDWNTFILGSGALLASCAFVYFDTRAYSVSSQGGS